MVYAGCHRNSEKSIYEGNANLQYAGHCLSTHKGTSLFRELSQFVTAPFIFHIACSRGKMPGYRVISFSSCRHNCYNPFMKKTLVTIPTCNERRLCPWRSMPC